MKAFLRRFLCVVTAALMITALCAAPASAASVKLNRTSLDLPTGYGFTLKVSGADGTVKWSCKDSSIVSVKPSDGDTAKITGKKTGVTYVYAETGGTALKCKVTVKKAFITADKSVLELSKGQSGKITLTVKGSKDIFLSRGGKDVCSVSWGKWNGDKISLNVKAKKNGISDLKFAVKNYESSTAETVRVKVGGKSPSQDVFYEVIPESDDDSPEEKTLSLTEQVIMLVNGERAGQGKPALESDPLLNEIAAMRAKEIAEKFSHTRPDGTDFSSALEANGITTPYVGENIAAGQLTPESVMNVWMNSSGHKRNILDGNFRKIGVGYYKTNDAYRYYWVEIFADDC